MSKSPWFALFVSRQLRLAGWLLLIASPWFSANGLAAQAQLGESSPPAATLVPLHYNREWMFEHTLPLSAIDGQTLYFKSDGVGKDRVGRRYDVLIRITRVADSFGGPIEINVSKIGEIVVSEVRDSYILGKYRGQPITQRQIKSLAVFCVFFPFRSRTEEVFDAEHARMKAANSWRETSVPGSLPTSPSSPSSSPASNIRLGKGVTITAPGVLFAPLMPRDASLAEYAAGSQDNGFKDRLNGNDVPKAKPLPVGALVKPILDSDNHLVSPAKDIVLVIVDGKVGAIFEHDLPVESPPSVAPR